MQNEKWISYNALAWTEAIIARPEDYAHETEFYINIIREKARIDVKTLLHPGCGAGCNDYTFKKHFRVTGVDISDGMLDIARGKNPEVAYLHGDMRSLNLKERFDAVAIPESIDYMVTLPDLERAINAACRHLNPGGLLLVAAKVREEFSENNFCYTGAKDNVEITVFENNYIPEKNPSTYEATMIYLIRIDGRLSIQTDCHKLGLFSRDEWFMVFKNAGLEVTQAPLHGAYDRFIMGEGQYPMQVFVGVKPL